MELNRRSVCMLCVGAIGGASVIFTVMYLRKLLRKSCTKITMEQLTDKITLSSLRKLTRMSNVCIRQCACNIVISRALKPEHLQFIVQWCYSDDEECVLKACTVLENLAKTPRFRGKVICFGGLEALSHAFYRSWTKNNCVVYDWPCKIQRLASIAIFDLISDDDRTNVINTDVKIRLVEKNPSFIPTVLGIMEQTEDREVEKWCLYLIHQITVCESTREKLKDHWQVVKVISQFVVKNQGDTLCLKFGYHILVTLANVLLADNEEMVLEEIRKCGVVRPAVGCLKSDNDELVYWVVGLIHEFAINNIAVEELVNAPILCKSLYSAMISSEASLQRLIVRVLRYLSENSQQFKMSVIYHKQLLARLPVCLASGDEDLASWSLFLIHDIAKTGGDVAIELLFEHSKGVIDALVQLSSKKTQDANTTCRYIAETLGFFCSMESIQCDVVKAGALKAVLRFAMMDDIDVKFWSTSLLLNLSMSVDILKEEMVKERGVGVLIDLAVSDTDEPQVAMQAAKTLIMLGFIDTPFCVHLKSSGYKSSCSILINDAEYSPNKLGINMVVMEPMGLSVVEAESFDTGHDAEASSKLIEFVTTLPLMSLVFVVVKGEANYFLTDDAKKVLNGIGVADYDFNTGELWLLSGQKRYDQDTVNNVEFIHGYDDVQLTFEVPQGYYVNSQVKALIMAPLLDILMSTPPESGISKVSELELLTILARHDSHRQVILEKKGFLDYMKKLIWNMASRSLSDLRSNPMLVAHCIGAMKTICGLVLSDGAVQQCLQSGVVKEVTRLLILINGTVLKAHNERKNEAKAHAKTNLELDRSFLSSDSGETEKAPFSSVNENTPYKNTMPVNVADTRGYMNHYEDFEEAFNSLTQLSVTILYHCNKQQLVEDCLYNSLSVHVLWCTLLLYRGELQGALAIPIENIITGCATQKGVLALNPDRPPVALDYAGKTKALMLSCDRFEVINFNWTFESIHATHAVGRSKYNHGSQPAGWYYEVQIKSKGIMQIGWRTELCKYGPEKGVGVGDDEHSCAFDGARMKIWSGSMCKKMDNDYGKGWVVDDIVSCLFSWDGEVSFWLNGEDLGVAFDQVDPELEHYPGVSLAMDQHCCFNFGGDKPFRFQMPDGYVAVNDVVEKRIYCRRPRSKSYTKGSFESIAEEDEENLDDVKNTHLSRLQRCSSSEPSLCRAERPKQLESLAVTKRRSSASNYNENRPTTPITSTTSNQSSTPSTPFTPVTPLSPFWSPVFARQSLDAASTLPCLYFETEVNDSLYRARKVGYFSRKTGECTSCEFYESQNMSFPSQGIENFNLVKAPSVIGCGMLWPDGIFFTMDGVFSNTVYRLPDEDPEMGDLLPYVTCPVVKINYGQEPFLFKQANIARERFAAVEMLHSFSCHLFNKFKY